MAATVSDLKANLEDAWEYSRAKNQALRITLRQRESSARRPLAGGSLSSVSANGQSSGFATSGSGILTAKDSADLWRTLIDSHDQARSFLTRLLAVSPSDADIFEWLMGSAAVAGSVRGWSSSLEVQNSSEAISDYSEAT